MRLIKFPVRVTQGVSVAAGVWVAPVHRYAFFSADSLRVLIVAQANELDVAHAIGVPRNVTSSYDL